MPVEYVGNNRGKGSFEFEGGWDILTSLRLLPQGALTLYFFITAFSTRRLNEWINSARKLAVTFRRVAGAHLSQSVPSARHVSRFVS